MKRNASGALPLAIAITLVGVTSSIATAEVIYRETFGNTGGRQTPNLYGWQGYDQLGTFFDTANNGFGIDMSTALGNPGTVETALPNVNAGPNNTAGDFSALPASRMFWNSAHRMVWTPEFPVNPALYQPGSIAFSFYLGNLQADVHARVVVRTTDAGVDKWYFSTQDSTTPAVAGTDFPTLAELKTVPYNPAAANWQLLNFDGTYNGGGWPEGPAAEKTSSSVAIDTPGPATADLTGIITAFGIMNVDAAGSPVPNPIGNLRFDTFQIDATPIGGGFNVADFNHANGVNGADLAILTTNFGSTTATNATGSADGDADVDGNDFLVWQRNVGNTSVAAIPEPAALALLVVGAAALATARRKTLQIHN